MKKTLVWHTGAMGDLLLSLPSIYAIRCGTGNRRLHLISRTDLADLVLSNGIADSVSSHENGFFAPLFAVDDLPGELSDFLSEFHSAFIFARRADPFFLRRIGRCISRTFFIQTVPPWGEVIHVSEFQLQNVRYAGIRGGEQMPVLETAVIPDTGSTRRIIAVHPGSGGRKKCWPVENYLELMSRLSSSGEYDFRILLGPAEDDRTFRKIAEWTCQRGDALQVVRNRPISHVAAVLKSSALFVGNDSGITHLASAVGVPTVAVFGPTDSRLWGPAGECVAVVRSGLACSPCGEQRHRCIGQDCLEEIEVDYVIAGIGGLLNS